MADARAGILPRALQNLTGVAAAFGLSVVGAVLGGMAAILIGRTDALPDQLIVPLWVALAAVGTVAAGATVADIAARDAWRAIVIAGCILFLAMFEIMQSVEATAAEATEWPTLIAVAVVYTGLLAVGVWLHARLGRGGLRA
jgi:hypothetical protein